MASELIAELEKRVLITDDKDFGELIFRLKKPSNGVVLFRTSTHRPEMKLGLLKGALEKSEKMFTVISESGIRVRKI